MDINGKIQKTQREGATHLQIASEGNHRQYVIKYKVQY